MDEHVLRRKVEAATGKLSNDIWRDLLKGGDRDVEGRDELDKLIVRARKAMLLAVPVRLHRSRLREALVASELAPEPPLLAIEELRRDVLTAHWRREAERHREVRRFRWEVLDGSPLTPEQAHGWLGSAAVTTFSLDAFRAAGIDPVRHESELIASGYADGVYRADIRIAGRRALWKYEERVDLLQADPQYANGRREMRFTAGRTEERVVYRVGSVFAGLVWAAHRIVLPGHPADCEETIWFILTGEFPNALAAKNSWTHNERATHRIAAINLTLAPWVSGGTVLAAFRKMQSELLQRHNRPISERRLTLFGFIGDHEDDDGNIGRWRELLPMWNASHPEWSYKDVRNLSRDYWATARQLLKPEYVWGDSEDE